MEIQTNDIPILTLKTTTDESPFVLVEICDFDSGNFQLKVRFADKNKDAVVTVYHKLKQIITNPLVIVKCYICEIIDDDGDFYKTISNFYENTKNLFTSK